MGGGFRRKQGSIENLKFLCYIPLLNFPPNIFSRALYIERREYMENLIIQSILILAWAIFLKEFILVWFNNVADDIVGEIKFPIQRYSDYSRTRLTITTIYYIIMGGCTLDIFGSYSILIVIIVSGIILFILLIIMLGFLIWHLLPKRTKDMIKRRIERN